MPASHLNSSSSGSGAVKSLKVTLQPLPESASVRPQLPQVPAQVAALNTAIASNTLSFNQLHDAVAVAGIISTIGHIANADAATLGSSPVATNALMSPPVSMPQKASQVLTISSLSEVAIGYPTAVQSELTSPVFNLGQRLNSTQAALPESTMINLSLMPLGSPVPITQLSDALAKVTVMDGGTTAVRITDFTLAQGLPDSFLNSNLAMLNVALPPTGLSSINRGSERIDFKVTGIELTTGITVSGTADGPNTSVLLAGDRPGAQVVSMDLSGLTNPRIVAEMNAIGANFATEFTPLFLAELSSIPAGEIQIRLVGTVAFADAEVFPGTLILGG